MNLRKKLVLAFAALICFTGMLFAQPDKVHTFRGKVEAVDAKAGNVTVNHGKVEGWMDAMTMAYYVDKPEVLKTVKVGDEITATVIDGDMVLHNVQVVPKK